MLKLLNKYSRPNIIIGLEITSSQIKLVELDVSRLPVKILNYAIIDILSIHTDNIAQQIKSIIEKNGIKARRVNSVISHSSIRHWLSSTPPMPEKEMAQIILREVNSKFTSAIPVYGWQIIGENEQKQKEILIAVASHEEVNQKISLIESAGLHCNLLTTIPLALLNSLRLIKDGERGAIVSLYMEKDRGHVIIARDGKWSFSREFSLEKEELDAQQVVMEVKRALLYFRKQFRGEELNRIIVNGENREHLHQIKKGLHEELALNIEEFQHVFELDLSHITGRIKEWNAVFPELFNVLGSALQFPRENRINLIPAEIKERKKRARRKVLTISAAAVIYLGLFGHYGWLQFGAIAQQKILRQREAEVEWSKASLEEIDRQETQRERYDMTLAFFEQVNSDRIPWVQILQRLSLIVPDEIVLHSLDVKREKDLFNVSLKGEITAPDSITIHQRFNSFYQAIQESPLFHQAEAMPLDIAPLRKKEALYNRSSVRITFQLKGET